MYQGAIKITKLEYTKSLFNATFGSGKKIVLTEFRVKQVKVVSVHTKSSKIRVSEGISVS